MFHSNNINYEAKENINLITETQVKLKYGYSIMTPIRCLYIGIFSAVS